MKALIAWRDKHETDGYVRVRSRMEKGGRRTAFFPVLALRFLGMEEEGAYQITVEPIEHEYI